MTFVTHPDDATLQRLHEGGLDEAEARATRTHVESCERCRAKSARFATLFEALSAPPSLPQPPADFLARVMAGVEAEGLVAVRARARAPERRLRAALSAIAAGAGAIATGGALAAAGGGFEGTTVGIANTLADAVTWGGVAGTVLQASAPILGGAALATLAILTPFFLKTIQTLQPRPATVRVPAR